MKFKIRSNPDRRLPLDLTIINAHAARWKPGTVFEVSVKRVQRKVSDPMRRYYFAVVLPVFLNAYGYDPEEALVVHERLKTLFFHVQPDDHGVYRKGTVPSVFGNDSEVPIDQKTAFMDWVKRKSAEEGKYTPDPGEAT